jgi:hypothetical protein
MHKPFDVFLNVPYIEPYMPERHTFPTASNSVNKKLTKDSGRYKQMPGMKKKKKKDNLCTEQ